MRSDNNMDNNNLLVGKHCMEISGIILSLCSTYSLVTTDLAANDSLCIYPTSIRYITLSKEEMLQFNTFYSEHNDLHRIGFSESSLLFVAKRRKIKVAVLDIVTERICCELGIETINVSRKKSEVPKAEIASTDSGEGRLSFFRIAACL